MGEGPGWGGLSIVRHPGIGQNTLGDVTWCGKDGLAHRIKLQTAARRIGDHDNRRVAAGPCKVWIGRFRQHVKAGEKRDEGEAHTRQHYRLAANLVREPTKDNVERCTGHGGGNHQQIDRRWFDLEELFEEDLAIEEAGVPNRTLGAHHRKEGDKDDLEVGPLAEGFLIGRFRQRALFMHFLEGWALRELQAHPNGNANQNR